MIEAMDEAVGLVLDALDRFGLADNTIVCFTSDNGGASTGDAFSASMLPLRGGKGRQWEGGIREPLHVRHPELVAPGTTCDVPVSGIDFYPTLLELAGLELPPEQVIDGRSMVPLLRGRHDPAISERDLFWHYPHYGNQGGDPSSMVRNGPWKLIHYHEDGHNELYHLEADPGERHDVLNDQRATAGDLWLRLQCWLDETGAKFPAPDPQYDAAGERAFPAPLRARTNARTGSLARRLPRPPLAAQRRLVGQPDRRRLAYDGGVMGTFTVDCELQELTGNRPPATIAGVMVDTGSEYTWLPEDLLHEAGVTVSKTGIAFVVANGATITRDIGYAYLRSGEFETVDEVVFARLDDLRLLGARTLEGFAARVDSRAKRLVAAGPAAGRLVRRTSKPAGRWVRSGAFSPFARVGGRALSRPAARRSECPRDPVEFHQYVETSRDGLGRHIPRRAAALGLGFLDSSHRALSRCSTSLKSWCRPATLFIAIKPSVETAVIGAPSSS